MANTKVFVSPGVYTSEVDLSFVSQSVGVTTLGIVGETLKGPAFEPIFITNFDEYTAFFGGTSPEKFINTQIPKYEAAYIAKAYLQQSNQLFVTRILGLSGYDAGPSWSITTVANVNQSTVDFYCTSSVTDFNLYQTCDPVCVDYEVFDYDIDFSGCTNSQGSIEFLSTLPQYIIDKIDLPYEQFNGSVTTLRQSMLQQIFDVMNEPTTEDESIYYYGPISGSDYSYLFSTGYTAETNVFQVDNVDASLIDYTAPINDPWYYALFDHQGSNSLYTGFSFYSVVSGLTLIPVTTTTTLPTPTVTPTPTNPCVTPTPITTTTTTAPVVVNCYTGKLIGSIYVFSGTAYTNYDDLVIATLRSRGLATYSTDNGVVYEVSGLTDVTLDCTGSFSAVTKNPYAIFGVNVTSKDGDTYFFETSFSNSDVNYIGKVFGYSNFSKPRTVVPLFLEERFQSLLNYGYRKGYIRGLNCELITLDSARSESSTSIGWYLEQYQSPKSPWVVSELRGNKVFNLFKFITIADGDSANTEVKISIANISFNNGTFDVFVRDFFDNDSNPVVIEKFTNCSMNPSENSFIAKKIGTSDGEFQLNSKYIMLEMNEDAPIDALPCGFEGYTFREYSGAKSPFPIYKTKYDFPGEVIYNPPFGTSTGTDDISRSPGDNVRRTYLGFSDTIGVDVDYLSYKGKQNPIDLCNATSSNDWAFKSQGFHMDKNASAITISNFFTTSGTSAFQVGSAEFTSDPDNESNPYYRLFARKFTLVVAGGFDGWDIYRESRTNTDRFRLGGNGYLKGACPTLRYPTAEGTFGAFKRIVVGNNREDFANTDYYAYLLGQQTFANPEAVNINVFVTPGIDYVYNSNLVESAIEMIEFDRADSIYICTTPDYNMFVPTIVGNTDLIYPQEAVDSLEESNIDSNYTATYYPWILTRDTVNNTQIYIPPTAEVCRNLALTDNIAFPWFAAAGYTRGIVNGVKARKKLTQEDRDTLYKGRINPIATFSDIGTVIWGNKTMQIRESALDRINVRRLLLQARKLISAVSVRLLFEQNDAKVRQDFLDAVNPILDAIRRDRGLYDFRVTVSSDPADLDRNQMTGKIYIKPTKSLEFIDITFYITPTGASFENI
jgi:hypothetical protein